MAEVTRLATVAAGQVAAATDHADTDGGQDVVLTVLAHTICTALRRRLPGYHTATPDTLQRRFLSTGGQILNHNNVIVVRLTGPTPKTGTATITGPSWAR